MSTTNEALVVSHVGGPGAWTGVLKDATGAIVAECGHVHPNRDQSSSAKSAAIPCMTALVRDVLIRNIVAKEAAAQREYDRQKEILLIKIPDRTVHPLVQRALELAPIIKQGPVFYKGRLVAVADRAVYDAWLANMPAENRKKFLW